MRNSIDSSNDKSPPTLLAVDELACETLNGAGHGDIVIACEHASNYIPRVFKGLGLSEKAKTSHAAFDPGAKALAVALSKAFDAPLVCSKVSRLVYDCNRPKGADSAMPMRSEIYDVPGNVGVSQRSAQARYEQIYLPFEKMLGDVVAKKTSPALISIHTFTPIYHGQKRAVEIGILHDEDARFADGMLDAAAQVEGFVINRNDPYGPSDGVAHTIDVHGRDNGLLNVMIEVRNDLLANESDVVRAAAALETMIRAALANAETETSGSGKQC